MQFSAPTNQMWERRVKRGHPQPLVVPVGEEPGPESEAQFGHDMPREGCRAFRPSRGTDRVSDTTLLELVQADLCVSPVIPAGQGTEFGMDHVAKRDFEHVEAAPERGCDLNVPHV